MDEYKSLALSFKHPILGTQPLCLIINPPSRRLLGVQTRLEAPRRVIVSRVRLGRLRWIAGEKHVLLIRAGIMRSFRVFHIVPDNLV